MDEGMDQELGKRTLIRQVREHPAIWEGGHPKGVDELSWLNVASRLHITVKEAKERWARLTGARRSAHHRRLNGVQKKDWKFEKEMSFLGSPEIGTSRRKSRHVNSSKDAERDSAENNGPTPSTSSTSTVLTGIRNKINPRVSNLDESIQNYENVIKREANGENWELPIVIDDDSHIEQDLLNDFKKKIEVIMGVLAGIPEQKKQQVAEVIKKNLNSAIGHSLTEYLNNLK